MTTSDCEAAILATLASVPEGKVCSYGQIASLSGYTGKARYVAYLLKHLPKDSRIPWHRIINSQGKIAFPKDSPKYLEQKSKLALEGLLPPIRKKDYDKYFWSGN